MKVYTLEDIGLDAFLEQVKLAKAESTDRNSDWFDPILKDPFKNGVYEDWYVIPGVIFATVQRFENTRRVLTRNYTFKAHRRYRLPDNDTLLTPSMYILHKQLENVDNAFVSFEYVNRRKAAERFCKKLNTLTDRTWIQPEGMYLTCADTECFSCWQNIIYTGKKPELDNITYNEWSNRFGTSRKTFLG